LENRSIFGEDMDKSLRLTFLATLYVWQKFVLMMWVNAFQVQV